MYERVKSEVLSITKCDENTDVSTTYLGRMDMTRLDKIKAEERFPVSENNRKAFIWHGMPDTLRYRSK